MFQTATYYAALFLETAAGTFGIRLYEEPRYDVVDHVNDQVEIRRYAPRLAAEVDYSEAAGLNGGEAFRLLFAYISGSNGAATTNDNLIAMTAPVEMRGPELIAMTAPVETARTGGTARIRFFLPAKFTRETAPQPTDPRVKLVTVPEETVAVYRFTGLGWDFRSHQADLVSVLSGSKWTAAGAPYALYYDGPFTLPFLRRNEAAVTVARRH